MARTTKIAWRNLGRNRRRTVITALALSIGIACCIASFGITDGTRAELIRTVTRLELGHVQLHHPEYGQARRAGLVDPRGTAETASSLAGVLGAAPRAFGFGLCSCRKKSVGAQLIGVDPRRERQVTDLHLMLEAGRYLDLNPTPWPRGRRLSAEEQRQDDHLTSLAERAVLDEMEDLAGRGARPPGLDRSATERLARELDPPPARAPRVLIGATLARTLAARPGDRMRLLTHTADAVMAEVEVEIAGVFLTGLDVYDRARVYLHLEDLQRLLHSDGLVHEIALRLARGTSTPATLSELRRLAPRALAQSWDQVRPDIGKLVSQSTFVGLLISIILVVAAFGVISTMLMSVMERTRELCMLKALGLSGWRIVQLVLAETGLLVLVSSAAGLVLGLLLDLYLVIHGLDLSAITGGGRVGVARMVRGEITITGLLVPVVVLGIMCFVAALYPAVRAARLRPAVGMRDV